MTRRKQISTDMFKKFLIILFILIVIAGGFWYFSKNKPQETEAAATKTGLVGWWTMDTNNATSTPYVFYDKSGLNNNATSTAAPTIVAGKIKQAVSLSGSQYLDIAHQTYFDNYPLTVSAWFKVASAGSGYPGIVNKYVSASANGWQIFTDATNRQLCAWYFKDINNYYACQLFSVKMLTYLTL